MSLLDRWSRKKDPALSRVQSLNAIPVRNHNVESERDDDTGETLIIIPRRDDRWVRFLSKLLFVPDHRKVTLDELGTFVWDRCDGETTVRDLIHAFAEQYKLSRKEAELSMVAFLRQMAKKRLVGLAIADPSAAPPAEDGRKGRSRKRKKKKQVKA